MSRPELGDGARCVECGHPATNHVARRLACLSPGCECNIFVAGAVL